DMLVEGRAAVVAGRDVAFRVFGKLALGEYQGLFVVHQSRIYDGSSSDSCPFLSQGCESFAQLWWPAAIRVLGGRAGSSLINWAQLIHHGSAASEAEAAASRVAHSWMPA